MRVAVRLIRDSRAGDPGRHRFSKALKRRFSQSAIRMTAARRADNVVVEVRGDLRAGSASSRLGFFGSPPQGRSAPWSVGNLPDLRNLGESADLTQVRAVLGTLVRDLQRYGLLGS